MGRVKSRNFAEAQTKNGCSTPSDYVRELIRTDQRRRAKDKLDAMLVEGLRSGDSIPVDPSSGTSSSREAMTKLAGRAKLD